MSTKALMIIAPADFRDEELFQTQKILESGGLQTEVVSQKKGLIRGVMGGQVQVEKILDDVSLTDYQAVIFVGGPGTTVYFDDEKVISFAKQAYGQGKIVAAICIAPVILAKSGILAGKKATVWSSPADKSYLDQLSKAGAILVNEPVVVDGQIITANGPTSAEQFGRQIKDLVKPS